jgi:hypothetical protein
LVPFENLFYVVSHDSDNFIHLGLLLCHPLLSHDLLHLSWPRQWLSIWTQGATIWTHSWLNFTFFRISHVSEFSGL